MINYIWFFLIFFGILVGLLTGNGEIISKAIISSSGNTVTFMIELTGIMCFWCGVMKVAENSGLTEKLSKLLKPILKRIFKEAAKDEKALGAIVMNLTANMMGLSNAATPFGIKAMEEMDRLNSDKETASNDMALFLVLNATCIQLVPSTIISIRAACNSVNPGIIILPTIASTATAAIVGVICCKILQKYF
ncbi:MULTISPECIES: nucleoside recognition domain-containing protein [Clostridium]|uniref:Spore maturation protein n=2 Tax=Clostridium TaxID=1485 RepID=A0A1B9BQD7_CLOBE|nr:MULTISPECIES: nucleoside recognition domain-containing protein [Clostridium]MBA8936209.1 spore maturation protein A [Clostridium beijerinckii]MBN7574423.1 spore maturation protein [Clostridium beijerinckii]MBN7579477.1 spore maturation protein [Clostridium beijerinckii]MBN7584274.1 spore maturation protein [Clostridium beijerinckii]MBO0520854.1 spore maturation protein [Clostridium beijerinckii]